MTEMIERVARAIYEASAAEFGRGPFEAASPLARRLAREQARAAIDAMRKPAPSMVAAGQELLVRQAEVDEAALWQAMAGAALTGEPGVPPIANDAFAESHDDASPSKRRSLSAWALRPVIATVAAAATVGGLIYARARGAADRRRDR